MFLLQPKRLDHALRELDTDGSGEVDIDECTARRPTCHPIDATPARRRGGGSSTAALSLRIISRVDSRTGEEAIYRGLAKRVEQLQAEQERRMRAAAAADEEFSAEFLTMARAVFDMIDKDQSGTLTKKEIVDAVANDKARTRRPTTFNP